MLVLALAAVLAGASDLRAIFRWGRRLPPEALFLLGLERASCHATDHHVFKALDVEATEAVLGDWVRGSDPLGHVALDGKRLRGSAPARVRRTIEFVERAIARRLPSGVSPSPRPRPP